MSEIHLFNIAEPVAREIPASAGGLEKSLQTLFERNRTWARTSLSCREDVVEVSA